MLRLTRVSVASRFINRYEGIYRYKIVLSRHICKKKAGTLQNLQHTRLFKRNKIKYQLNTFLSLRTEHFAFLIIFWAQFWEKASFTFRRWL